ncbi:MAG: winged helix-turn-helix transcriptional regulator [Gemmatimonadales bacterium]|nr:winged helix-turn-helix transcriptional regulator [Gemmatimonadales bacterium]
MATPMPFAEGPTSAIPFPAGQRGPRGFVLIELKRHRSLTAKDLAQHLELSLNAVRHHLKELEAEGLVEYAREARGVGAPVYVYTLTPLGEALFPSGYEDALTAVLEEIVARDGREAAVSLVTAHFAAIVRRVKAETEGQPAAKRLAAVARALTGAGYMAEWGASGGTGTLREHNCAIRAVAERFPEICAAERAFLEEVLGAEVERTQHLLDGCAACEYSVRFKEQG